MTPEHGPASAETGGPPRLRLHLLRRLQALALMNALPMIAVVLILVGWWQGKIGFKLGHSAMSTVLAMVAAILAGCAVLAFCGWVILPIARWLRASPAWHFRHGSRWLWALPALGGWLAWLGTWLVCACCTLTALAVVAWGLWNLVMLAIQAGPSATAAPSALPGALYHSGATSSLPARMLCQSGSGGEGGIGAADRRPRGGRWPTERGVSPLMKEPNNPAEPIIEPLGSGLAGL